MERHAIYGTLVLSHDAKGNPVMIKRMNVDAMIQQRALHTGERVLENGFLEFQIANVLCVTPHPHIVKTLYTRLTPTECQIVMPFYPN